MSQVNNFVFRALHVIAWAIFIGLSIEAGGLIVNFIFSVFKPEMVAQLYQKLDLSKLYGQNKWAYFGSYSFIIFIAVLKAILFYIVILLLHKLDLKKPFSSFAAGKISQISYCTLSIGLISYVAGQTLRSLTHHGYEMNKVLEFLADSQAFILMAAVIYIIATIFKKGIDIQNENDLTV